MTSGWKMGSRVQAALIGLCGAVMACFPAGASEPCTIEETSPSIDRKIRGWYQDAFRAQIDRKAVVPILKKIEKEQAKSKYNCRDQLAMRIAALYVGSKSTDLERAIQSLEPLVAGTRFDGSGVREDFVHTLVFKYNLTGRIEAAAALGERELPTAPPGLRPPLAQSIAVKLASDGELDSALTILTEHLDLAGEHLMRDPFHLALALAAEQEHDAAYRKIEATAADYFENLWLPAPHPLAGDNLLQTMIQRIADPRMNAQPVRPPIPSYPFRAAERGLEGECWVKADIDAAGMPRNIDAECTDDAFKREATRSFERVRFSPLEVDGQAYERDSVFYPIEFQLAD